MNKKALLRLADKLSGRGPYLKNGPIKKHRFDMGTWIEIPFNEETQEYIPLPSIKKNGYEVVKPNLPCGTAACAGGWAGADPWFRKRGLYTSVENDVFFFHKDGTVEKNAFNALAQFFDISYFESSHLFGYNDDGYNNEDETPKQVAKRIRDFVKDKERNNYHE